MSSGGNMFLDLGVSEESDLDDGYDSEAAELSKSARVNAKRRKLSHSDDEEDGESAVISRISTVYLPKHDEDIQDDHVTSEEPLHETEERHEGWTEKVGYWIPGQSVMNGASEVEPKSSSKKKRNNDKVVQPGVIYLSSLPPYLKPSALRNLLTQRGFTPITRLFLTPASKAKSTSKKNSRQLYTEGWIEFESKKTARRCAESLNAQIIGGRKGGFYHDDLWNMKYLKGMGWSELMAGIREEKREEEGRRDEERRQIAKETKRFIEGVEEGRRIEGIKRKRSGKAGKGGANTDGGADADGDVKRTWRQFEVKGKNKSRSGAQKQDDVDDDVRKVLGKIF